MAVILDNLRQALMVTVFVFVMMMFIDYLNVLTKGKMSGTIKGGLFRQYVLSSFLGATPGCLGAFMNVSFYVRGLISFGAITGGMLATSGDESFVMLAMFPRKALILFFTLFIIGIVSAYIIDKLLKIKPCRECRYSGIHLEDRCGCFNMRGIVNQFRNISLSRFLMLFLLVGILYGFISGTIGPKEWNWQRITFISLIGLANFIIITVPDHYLNEHIWEHIFKKHLWRIFLWSFGALLLVSIGLKYWDLDVFVKNHMVWVLLISGVVGIVPESGPHLIFVMMFAKGLVPFSVLLTSSIVQDGHGMLPLFSYTVKDSLLIKVLNLGIGLGIGAAAFYLGF